MNALNPPVSVLIKLAKSLSWDTVEKDPELLEWYDRMAQLEYVPVRESRLLENMVAIPAVVAGFQDGLAHATKISEGQTASLSLLDGPEDQVECGMVISAPGKRVGYQIFARHPTEGIIASYLEASTLSLAAEGCLDEFPQAEGFKDHMVKDTESGVEIKVPPIPEVMLSFQEMFKQHSAPRQRLVLDSGVVVDTKSSGLSLDEGED